ncbi:MAG: DUF853 domain-containing protein [Spirochaetes bacterium]|jgi:hypothetical protein|nr:DUF853 domain-containing protein [Spirochaetota bacterium]
METAMFSGPRDTEDKLLVAMGDGPAFLIPRMACRHGLIAGATGTGKTVTMQVMAEQLSMIGVPVFIADIKGDLGGIGYPGGSTDQEVRARELCMNDFVFQGNPVAYWQAGGRGPGSIRATVGRMGPLFLSRLLGLSDAQTQSLYQVFKIARNWDISLRDLKDLFGIAGVIVENAGEFEKEYGRISAASFGSFQRALLMLEDEGEDSLFSDTVNFFDVRRLVAKEDGKGVINILDARNIVHSPGIYAAFLLWLINELYMALPERGDRESPVIAFFFDEAHLLFRDAPGVIVERVEKLVKLIRSKGVAVFFVTQHPADIPDAVLGQLGNRVQHAMRAFTPREQRAVRAIAETFRADGSIDVEEAIMELGIGEAVVSFLGNDGVPATARRAYICPPRSMIGSPAVHAVIGEAVNE